MMKNTCHLLVLVGMLFKLTALADYLIDPDKAFEPQPGYQKKIIPCYGTPMVG